MNRALLSLLALALLGSLAQAAPMTVPFVGCPSDGQLGSAPAPQGKPKAVTLDAHTTARLAFYQSNYGDGFVAPRGWNCAGLVGSDGWGLFMALSPVNPSDLLKAKFHVVTGPFIEVWLGDGETSGRFEVAQTIARYFPKRMDFVQKVIAMDLGYNAGDFPRGPYPGDRLLLRSDHVVEYLTPAHTWGLGTQARMRPDNESIRSAAILLDGEPPSSVVISIRLPKDMADLAPVILHQAERQYAGAK